MLLAWLVCRQQLTADPRGVHPKVANQKDTSGHCQKEGHGEDDIGILAGHALSCVGRADDQTIRVLRFAHVLLRARR